LFVRWVWDAYWLSCEN